MERDPKSGVTGRELMDRLFPVRPGTPKMLGWAFLAVVIAAVIALVAVQLGGRGPNGIVVGFFAVGALWTVVACIRVIRHGEPRRKRD